MTLSDFRVGMFWLVVFGFFFANTALASEIQYAHVEEVQGEKIHVQYKGPGGVQNFVCAAVGTDCEKFGTDSPVLFPAIDGVTDYENSPDGNYGIVGKVEESETGSTTYTHTLYKISKDKAEEVIVIPYEGKVEKYKFPWVSDHLVLFSAAGEVVTYDIENKKIDTIIPSQSELPLRSLSPHAKYLSAYNYTEEAHKIWNTKTGEEIIVPSKTPAYVEFSQDEKYGAFIDVRDGFQTLYLTDLAKKGEKVKRVFADDFTVEDYVWFKNDLYAIGNTEADPYRWVLYRYDVDTKKTEIVAENVSYGDYMRPIGEVALSFLVIDGKNTHVALYDSEKNQVRVISPVFDSPASKEIKRSVVEFKGGVYGVLYEPKNKDKKPDLYVWLHGGPKRQTSFGYHSYLSYAVYDELLEKIVESGAYVLKLDYAGSYGYGTEFMDSLTDHIGDRDVKQVIEAARKIQREYKTDDTYLIGNSYGGYLGPKALVEKPKMFAGAIAINGVFDWLTLLERIPSSPFKTYFKGLPNLDDLDENFELYEQASIIKDLPDLKKEEILLVYGENDATVPTWQTREFFYQAKSLGKNVDLLKLEGEDHIIRQRDNLDKLCEFIADELLIKNLKCK